MSMQTRTVLKMQKKTKKPDEEENTISRNNSDVQTIKKKTHTQTTKHIQLIKYSNRFPCDTIFKTFSWRKNLRQKREPRTPNPTSHGTSQCFRTVRICALLQGFISIQPPAPFLAFAAVKQGRVQTIPFLRVYQSPPFPLVLGKF